MNSTLTFIAVVLACAGGLIWALTDTVMESEARWVKYSAECQSRGGHPEAPRGGYMQCWNTETGTRIFWDVAQ